MSAGTRWDAPPSALSEHPNLKRSRSDIEQDDNDDDDDISLVSHTPSPQPDVMDVDSESRSIYDDYGRDSREVITIETRIKSTNKGFAMLAKLGWAEGQPLGLSGDGRVDPIPFQVKRDLTGLGKTSQDVRMIESTVSQRRDLDSERQQKETEDQRKAREDSVARRTALQTEISTTLKAFYCTLCDKQFKNVAQYDEHTNSYAHHHKARFKDMQANVRIKPKDEVDKIKEKERKREEKELRKIAAAAGIKMSKPPPAPMDIPKLAPAPAAVAIESTSKSGGFKKAGWASVSSAASIPAASTRSGWAPASSAMPEARPSPTNVASSSTLFASTSSVAIPSHPAAPPAFRTAGWTSLDTGSSQPFPPPPPTMSGPLPSPSALPSAASAPFPSSAPPSRGDWTSFGSAPLPLASVPAVPPLPSVVAPAQPVRSGWQQFQQKGQKRK